MTENVTDLKAGMDPFEAAVRKMILMKPGVVSNGNNACYGGVSKRTDAGYGWACHAMMSSLPTQTEIVWSAWMAQSRPDSDAFFDWITSGNSPWKIAFDMGMSFSDKKYFNRIFWKSQGFIFDNLKKIPSNVLQQFLIASRIPRQHMNVSKLWHELVKGGICPELSLILAANFPYWAGNSNTSPQAFTSDLGDFPLNAVSGNGQYVKNFLEHRMDESRFNPPYFESHKYTPVNALWGNSGESHKYGLHIARLGGVDPENSWLGKYVKSIGKFTQGIPGTFNSGTTYTSWTCTVKDLIEVGKQEEKRMGV